MDYSGKWYSSRDRLFLNSINAELMRDVINVRVVLFKIVPVTATNIYGEVSVKETRMYYPGVEMTALRKKDDPTTTGEVVGPSVEQIIKFAFREKSLQEANFYPEIGDLIFFNNRYCEIDNVIQEQLLGGQAEKSHSIVCDTHYSRLTAINIMER